MIFRSRHWILFGIFLAMPLVIVAQPDDPRQKHYGRSVRSVLMKHCFSCHNGEDKKAGINFDNYFFISSLVREGELFQKIVGEIKNRTMPPDNRPPLTQTEIDTVTFYINSYLETALAEKDPGVIAPRRLNNQEYKYAIKDLLNVDINVDSIFPSDPSGGAGFDNHASVLYLSPLLLERYFDTADNLLESLFADTKAWRNLVPEYKENIFTSLRNFWYRTFLKKDVSLEKPTQFASKILLPFATLAYRGFLSPEEKSSLLKFFKETYVLYADKTDRFDESIKETMKLMLVSHSFLYRIERDPDIKGAYEISNFELASRLSFFLWSSIPDQALLDVAYREELHDPKVLEREVKRMLKDPKAKRLSEHFAIQWLELKKLKDPTLEVDRDMFPAFTPALRDLMVNEVELFFNHVLLESKNLLELIDSKYSFINETLANHYGLQDVEGDNMRKVYFTEDHRGGVLGMAGVLTATSLPTRTSPVLRGKWVLEQILGTPPPPPPADVPDLEASHDTTKSVETLRVLLDRHRADPACSSCHQAMDPIGLGLENFDGVGRWRNAYGTEIIDASGVMKTGEPFNGPADLRKILLGKKELFAKNFSQKMLSFALGRSIKFKDSPTVKHLQETMLTSDFNSQALIIELIKSYPFRYKKSDTEDVPLKPKKN